MVESSVNRESEIARSLGGVFSPPPHHGFTDITKLCYREGGGRSQGVMWHSLCFLGWVLERATFLGKGENSWGQGMLLKLPQWSPLLSNRLLGSAGFLGTGSKSRGISRGLLFGEIYDMGF